MMKVTPEAVGTLNPDGTIAEWPRVRADGQSYNRSEGLTTRKIGGGRFVVLPHGFTDTLELDSEPTLKRRYARPEPLEVKNDD